MTEVDQELLSAVSNIRPEGWWSRESWARYVELAERLVGYGLPREVVVVVLTEAFNAAEDEHAGPAEATG